MDDDNLFVGVDDTFLLGTVANAIAGVAQFWAETYFNDQSCHTSSSPDTSVKTCPAAVSGPVQGLLDIKEDISILNSTLCNSAEYDMIHQGLGASQCEPRTTVTPSDAREVPSPAQALLGIEEEMFILNSILRNRIAANDRIYRAEQANGTRKNAIELLLNDEFLKNNDDIIAMMDLFNTSYSCAEIYLQLQRKSLRECWVRNELRKVGHTIPSSD
ncbi:hypothetical protein APHAL10511_008613 [Amanita phalloides]|nr:hypothetical protein APHAL10511_008613 [Amanita phalloides]